MWCFHLLVIYIKSGTTCKEEAISHYISTVCEPTVRDFTHMSLKDMRSRGRLTLMFGISPSDTTESPTLESCGAPKFPEIYIYIYIFLAAVLLLQSQQFHPLVNCFYQLFQFASCAAKDKVLSQTRCPVPSIIALY